MRFTVHQIKLVLKINNKYQSSQWLHCPSHQIWLDTNREYRSQCSLLWIKANWTENTQLCVHKLLSNLEANTTTALQTLSLWHKHPYHYFAVYWFVILLRHTDSRTTLPWQFVCLVYCFYALFMGKLMLQFPLKGWIKYSVSWRNHPSWLGIKY